MEQTAEEIKRLRACINDLISVLALPALWSGHEPSQVVSTLLDVLLGILRLDFAYVRLSDSIGGGAPIGMVRSAQRRNLTAQPQEIGQILNPWLTGEPRTSPLVVPNPIGEGEVSIAPLRLGLQDEVGVLVAGSRRADFPTEVERLLLRVAANQAAIALQEARLMSEQRRAAEEIRFQAGLLDAVDQAVVATDMKGLITYWNRFAEQLYGWSASEVIAHNILDVTPAQGSQSAGAEILSRLQRGERWSGECLVQHRNGTIFPVLVTDSPIYNSREVLIGVVRVSIDITERKRAEEELEQRVVERTRQLTAVNEELRKEIIERKRAEAELRESEQRYKHIFQTAGVSIWEEDFSQVEAAIDDLKGQGVRDFSQYLAAHPEFVQQAISMVKIIDVNDATVKLFEAQSKDELVVSLRQIFLPETQEVFAGELIAIAEGRTNFESETVLQTLKGDKLAVLFTITFPRQPAKLNIVLVSIMDITERKRADEVLHKTQAELAHVTRVATLGELTASIAHEVNQPIAAIVTNGNACLRWLGGDTPNLDEAREAARRIIRDGKRAGEVIARIRALVRKTGTEKKRLDLNEAIQEVVALAQGEVRRNRVALRTDLAGDLPPVLGDRVQLQQVVLNLLMNGIEAMSAVEDRPRELVISTQSGEINQVRVTVHDSGLGLDPQSRDRIFEAFYTTKRVGMGMGLSISRSIVENHGGRLWTVANDGPGATFQFTLLQHH